MILVLVSSAFYNILPVLCCSKLNSIITLLILLFIHKGDNLWQQNQHSFHWKKIKNNHAKTTPVCLRVTIEGKRFEVATNRQVEPSEWLPSVGKVKGKSEFAIETNNELGLIKKQVYDYHERIMIENRYFSGDSLSKPFFRKFHCKKISCLLNLTLCSNAIDIKVILRTDKP
jgi:hypothetical protein